MHILVGVTVSIVFSAWYVVVSGAVKVETKGESVGTLGLVWLSQSRSVAWVDVAIGGVVKAVDVCAITESGN